MPKKEIGNFTEAELRAFISESPIASRSKEQKEQTENISSVAPSEGTYASAEEVVIGQGEESLFPDVKEDVTPSPTSVPSPTSDTSSTKVRRVSSKQRKLSLDEYRATFLRVPRVVNRRPVFVSEEVRQKLDLIVLRLSDTRRMSEARLCFRNPKTTLPALSDGTNPLPTVADFRVRLLTYDYTDNNVSNDNNGNRENKGNKSRG